MSPTLDSILNKMDSQQRASRPVRLPGHERPVFNQVQGLPDEDVCVYYVVLHLF